LGAKVAEYYNHKAKKLNELWHSNLNPKHDLAFLPFETQEAHDYYLEMKYCVDFAFANRKLMMSRLTEVLAVNYNQISFEPIINIAHNYAAWEAHFGEKVVIHRKGATSAKAGETGIIPGSQGTNSYIVEGLGNTESFMSCSHGAGRKMSRSMALKTLNLEDEIRRLDEKVMDFQKDLVKIKYELLPLAVIKG